MMRAALWAGLLGAAVNGVGLLVHDLFDRRPITPGKLGFSAILFPFCALLGLVVASLLRDLNERGAPRWHLAAVALPSGSLILLAVPTAALWGLLGWDAVAPMLTFRDPESGGFAVLCLATGAASGLGVLIGLPRPQEDAR
jgi:hypothetical protein